jgi:chloramphenicol-sensitive protein RarD
MTEADQSKLRNGLILGVGAYLSWGILPLYLRLLRDVPAMQLLAHRVVWSVLFLLVVVIVTKQAKSILAAARGRTLLLLVASALMIGINWLVYIWSVQNAHVIEASLGYFMNPLVNVAFGVALLGEKLRRWQGIAIGIAAIGVVALAIIEGGAIWISLVLAASFSIYGLIRKVAAIDALGGLTVETVLLAPFLLGYLLIEGSAGRGSFGQSSATDWLLILSGVITAMPLLMFAASARRLRYTTIGLLQFMSPSLQFGLAVLVFGEPLRPEQAATFVLIWVGCGLYAWDSLRAGRREVIAPAVLPTARTVRE